MLNTIQAKSLKESGIITEHTSNKIVVCAKKNSSGVFFITTLFALFPLLPAILLIEIINTSLSSGVGLKPSEFIQVLFLCLIMIAIILGVYKYYLLMREGEILAENFYILKNKAEIFKYVKIYPGDEHTEKYSFNDVERILITKKIYSENRDEYHVLLQLLEGKKIPIFSDGFYEKRPALDLAECINQFMNLPPDSIEINHEVIG